MNKLILYIIAFLIGILLFKLLYNCECFNVGIQNGNQNKINISQELVLNTQNCNPNPKPKNIIGFIQPTWNDSVDLDLVKNSKFTVLIDAFLVNYESCWLEQPINASITLKDCFNSNGEEAYPTGGNSSCGERKNAPCCNYTKHYGKYACKEFYENSPKGSTKGGNSQAIGCSSDNDFINTVNSLTDDQQKYHGFKKIRYLMDHPESQWSEDIQQKLLISLGGWNMGGTNAEGTIIEPSTGNSPISECLEDPKLSGSTIYNHIKNIRISSVQGNATLQVYDGIDIDIETSKAWAAESAIEQKFDNESRTIDGIYNLIKSIHNTHMKSLRSDRPFYLSTSPRATDICNSSGEPAFMGEVIDRLKGDKIYFDYINPQFYNDIPERNIPTTDDDDNGKLIPGEEAIKILNHILQKYNSSKTTINIGMLSKNDNNYIDGNLVPPGVYKLEENKNPGVNSGDLVDLWDKILEKVTEPKENLGIMTWFINKSNDPKENKIVKADPKCTADDCNHISQTGRCEYGKTCPGTGEDKNNWNWASEIMQ